MTHLYARLGLTLHFLVSEAGMARPKSMSLTLRGCSRRFTSMMFSSLMSVWMRPIPFRAWSAMASCKSRKRMINMNICSTKRCEFKLNIFVSMCYHSISKPYLLYDGSHLHHGNGRTSPIHEPQEIDIQRLKHHAFKSFMHEAVVKSHYSTCVRVQDLELVQHGHL